MTRHPQQALASDERGVTIIEFGFLAPVMLLMVMMFLELSHRVYAQSVLTGAVQAAARDATLEGGGEDNEEIDEAVERQVSRVVGLDAEFESSRSSYTDFRSIGTPEVFRDKSVPLNNRYDVGVDCFIDMNGNGTWNVDAGADGQGGAQDAVLYTMSVSYQPFFPVAGLLEFLEGTESNGEANAISASTVLRNQPWDQQRVPPRICPPGVTW